MSNTQVPLAIVPSEERGIIFRQIGDTQMLKAKMDKILEIQSEIMTEGVHFGPPFKDSKKKVLLKAGAELLGSYFGLYPRYIERSIAEDFKGGTFHYRYECQLIDIYTGAIVGSGIGSCNSMEAKYRWRDSKPKCPACGAESIMKSKFPDRNTGKIGFYCNQKSGGCGSNFDPDDKRITGQEVGRVENDDPYTLVNTLDKQAQKRAFVAAVLNATGASAYFTQDVEDFKGHKYFGDPDVIEGDYEEIKAPTTTTEPPSGTPPSTPTTSAGTASTKSSAPNPITGMTGDEAKAMMGNGNKNGRRIGGTPTPTVMQPPAPPEPPMPETPEEPPASDGEETTSHWSAVEEQRNYIVGAIQNQTGDTKLLWETIRTLVPGEPTSYNGQEFAKLAVAAWQAKQKPAGTRLGQTTTTAAAPAPQSQKQPAQDVIIDAVRYIQSGNTRYLEFAKGNLRIRRYDRSGTFRKEVGDEYYNENGFEQMVPMTAGDEPYSINPIQIFYEAKDGYNVATKCVPITNDKALDQYFGEIPFPEAG